MENNSFKINEEFFNLHEVIKNAFQVVGFQADRQKIKLRDPSLALNEYEIFKKIRGDSRRYLQIMINFLSNALKFSNRSSEIRINIRLNEMIAKAQSAKDSLASMPSKESIDELTKPKPKEKCFFINFEIEVQDFGCGIPPEKMNSLFINFNKIDEHQKRNKFGVGLGLSICKSLIEQMAGHVDVQSDVGKGTKFIINFKTVC